MGEHGDRDEDGRRIGGSVYSLQDVPVDVVSPVQRRSRVVPKGDASLVVASELPAEVMAESDPTERIFRPPTGIHRVRKHMNVLTDTLRDQPSIDFALSSDSHPFRAPDEEDVVQSPIPSSAAPLLRSTREVATRGAVAPVEAAAAVGLIPSTSPGARRHEIVRREETPHAVDRVKTSLTALQSSTPDSSAPPAFDRVLDLVHASPDDIDRVLVGLRGRQAELLPSVARYFPGALWFDRRLPYRRLPRAREVSAFAAALAAFGPDSVPVVRNLLLHSAEDVRFFAGVVAIELNAPELLSQGAQLLLDSDLGVRKVGIALVQALRHSPEAKRVFTGLRRAAVDASLKEIWRERSLLALGELGDASALPTLIQLLEDRSPNVARAAHAALTLLTAHDEGMTARAWAKWSKNNALRHRFQWLVDGLADRRQDLRAHALLELERITGESFGVTESAQRDACVAAQEPYLRWWQGRPL